MLPVGQVMFPAAKVACLEVRFVALLITGIVILVINAAPVVVLNLAPQVVAARVMSVAGMAVCLVERFAADLRGIAVQAINVAQPDVLNQGVTLLTAVADLATKSAAVDACLGEMFAVQMGEIVKLVGPAVLTLVKRVLQRVVVVLVL